MIIVPFANARLKTRVVEAGGRWGEKDDKYVTQTVQDLFCSGEMV